MEKKESTHLHMNILALVTHKFTQLYYSSLRAIDWAKHGGFETPVVDVMKGNKVSGGGGDSDLNLMRKNAPQITLIFEKPTLFAAFEKNINHTHTTIVLYVQLRLFPNARITDLHEVARLYRVDVDADVAETIARVPIVGVEVEFDREEGGAGAGGVEYAQIAPVGARGDGGARGRYEEGEAVGDRMAFHGRNDKFDGGVERYCGRSFPQLHWFGVQDAADTQLLWETVDVGFRETEGRGGDGDVGVALVG